MKLTVIHRRRNCSSDMGPGCARHGLLHFALSTPPIGPLALWCLSSGSYSHNTHGTVIAIPHQWGPVATANNSMTTYHDRSLPVRLKTLRKNKADLPPVISNARFVTTINRKWLARILDIAGADVTAVNVDPDLTGYCEKPRLTSQAKVAGFRRLYNDLAQPGPMPTDWPHHVFLKPNALSKLLNDGTLPLRFTDFLGKCYANSLTLQSLNVGGTVLDLETEPDLLTLLKNALNSMSRRAIKKNRLNSSANIISPHAALFGKILLGKNVHIERNALIVGPAIIADNVKIPRAAVIRASIIGTGAALMQSCPIQNRILFGPPFSTQDALTSTSSVESRQKAGRQTVSANHHYYTADASARASLYSGFRTWPRFSYARTFKRLADIIAAVAVLILFAPFFPIIALAVKLSSPGTVFFKDKRQGLRSRQFHCLKFRTMFAGADKLQSTLRFMNQADGPQFKMHDDPRASAVGRFLRNTSIDEIPQFLNVLLGQMSVVGPRPSPETENSLCPTWRYARLSVRPGITGLWQISRTRQPYKDFQEWLYYDIEYVRKLSLRLDLYICCKTVKKLIKDFVRQF